MTVILGIDAAWTLTQPSGVALVAESQDAWRVLRVAPSYEAFLTSAETGAVDWAARRFRGSRPRVADLLAAARAIAGSAVDLITLDMPVSRVAFSGRRAADAAVSRAFGAHGCSTHSPTAQRPGSLSADLMEVLHEAGYPLATTCEVCGTLERTLEVYPHPALLRLLDRDYRLPYKVGKSRRYWPDTDVLTRIALLLDQFKDIDHTLTSVFGDTGLEIPEADEVRTLTALKRYEDAIDALICGWVGARYTDRSATAYGDETAAIWVPDQPADRVAPIEVT